MSTRLAREQAKRLATTKMHATPDADGGGIADEAGSIARRPRSKRWGKQMITDGPFAETKEIFGFVPPNAMRR